MPLYEYQCTACGKLTEKRQKFSDPELTDCPHCGGRLERTITAPAVQFKGGGWYADLYSKGGKKTAGSGSAESNSSGDGAKGESSSKPAESSTPASAAPSTPSGGSGGGSAPSITPSSSK